MSGRDIAIVLDGETFRVPALNIGQLELVTEAFDGPRSKIPFAIVRIALERATPAADLKKIAPTMDEVADAVKVILTAAGLQKSDENPPVLKVVNENG
jgi:hypothetical protein